MSTPRTGSRVSASRAIPTIAVIELGQLRDLLREAIGDLAPGAAPPDFYSQRCLPPGMTRHAFLEVVRRGELPARLVGKLWMVARADFHAFVTAAPLVRVRLPASVPANDVRALVRSSQRR